MWGYLAPLLRLDFWFNQISVDFTPWVSYLLIGVFALAVVLGVVFYAFAWRKNIDKEHRRFLRQLGTMSFWAGVSGFALYAMTWQRIPVLSMRFFFVVWLFIFGYWKWLLIRRYVKEMPLLRQKEAEKAAYEKWLPKPKRK